MQFPLVAVDNLLVIILKRIDPIICQAPCSANGLTIANLLALLYILFSGFARQSQAVFVHARHNLTSELDDQCHKVVM